MDAERKKNLLLLAATVLLFFGVFEAVLRVIYITTPSELYAPDRVLERRLAPNFHTVIQKPDFTMDVQTNSLGLREQEIGPKQPGVTRVLVVGDSYAFGFGVQQQEAFPARLEERLKAEGRQVGVLNAGVFGWGPDQELLWLADEGMKLQPDVVVLAFYVGNDVLDSADKKFFELRDGKLVRVKPELTDAELKSLEAKAWLRKNLFVYAFLSEKIRTVLEAGKTAEGEPVDESEMFREEYSPEVERGFGVALAAVKEMAAVARERGAEPVLLVIPSRHQYVKEKCGPSEKCLDLDGGALALDYDKPNRRIEAFAAAEGLPLVDLLQVFLTRPDAAALDLPADGHWNAAGHEVAAKALAEALKGQGLV